MVGRTGEWARPEARQAWAGAGGSHRDQRGLHPVQLRLEGVQVGPGSTFPTRSPPAGPPVCFLSQWGESSRDWLWAVAGQPSSGGSGCSPTRASLCLDTPSPLGGAGSDGGSGREVSPERDASEAAPWQNAVDLGDPTKEKIQENCDFGVKKVRKPPHGIVQVSKILNV